MITSVMIIFSSTKRKTYTPDVKFHQRLFIVDDQHLYRKMKFLAVISPKIIMDGDYLFDWLKSILLVNYFFGHEYDEYPVSIIVSISCCFSCKVVLEEVLEKRALKGGLRANSCTPLSSFVVVRPNKYWSGFT